MIERTEKWIGGNSWIVNPFWNDIKICESHPMMTFQENTAEWRMKFIATIKGRQDAFCLGYGIMCAAALTMAVFNLAATCGLSLRAEETGPADFS